MELLGIPIFAWGGMLLFFITIFQVLSGSRKITIDAKFHRWLGWSLLFGGFIHGMLALAYILA